jgi:hypothetical protein
MPDEAPVMRTTLSFMGRKIGGNGNAEGIVNNFEKKKRGQMKRENRFVAVIEAQRDAFSLATCCRKDCFGCIFG